MIKTSIFGLLLISSTVFAGNQATYKGLVVINQEGRGAYDLKLKVTMADSLDMNVKSTRIHQIADDGLVDFEACQTSINAPVLVKYEARITNAITGESETVIESVPLNANLSTDYTSDCATKTINQFELTSFYTANANLKFKKANITIEIIGGAGSPLNDIKLVKTGNTYSVQTNLDNMITPYWWFYAPSEEVENGIYTGYTQGKIEIKRQ